MITFNFSWALALALISHCLLAACITTETIFQFPEPVIIKNLAVRSNGEILLSLQFTASLYALNPLTRLPRLIYTFPNATSLHGISEVSPDVFVLVIGEYSVGLGGAAPNTQSVWKVAFKETEIDVWEVTDLPEGLLLNGVETLPGYQNAVLIADSRAGRVYKVDVDTGDYEIAIEVDEMYDEVIGVNGIHIRDGYLYWSNTRGEAIYRLEIDKDGHAVDGAEVELVVDVGQRPDDFCFDHDGNLWITTHITNEVVFLSADGGDVVTVVGSLTELTVAGANAFQWGRTRWDDEILYVVTDGARRAPVNGTIEEGGKVVAVNTTGFEVPTG